MWQPQLFIMGVNLPSSFDKKTEYKNESLSKQKSIAKRH